MRHVWITLVLACALAAGSVWSSEPKPGATAALHDLFQREWSWRLEQSPLLTSAVGDHSREDQLDQVSSKLFRARLPRLRAFRAELADIDVAALPAAEKVNAQVFATQLDNAIGSIEVRDYLLPMTSDSSFYADLDMLTRQYRFDRVDSIEHYLDRLEQIPRYFDQHIVLLQEGVRRGITLPQVVLQGRELPLREFVELTDVTTSDFYAPLKQLGAAISAKDAERLQQRARRILSEQLQPAYGRLLRYFVEHYVPHARTTLAAEALPDGKTFYRQQIRNYTTLDLEPKQIHQIGLDEVARIRADMEKIRTEVGFKGDLTAYFAYLLSAPESYAQTPEQLLMMASYIAKRIDGLLPRYFGQLPRLPYTVAPVPDAIAPYYTSGRYVPPPSGSLEPGTYWVNTSKLQSRPIYVLPALTLHEAVPGHHLQGALADEQSEQPPFRRFSYISAYGEGWALYAEWLGQEMGVYRTPQERFGRLTYEMWRACRLVVDTGIHSMDWSRQQALDYMKANTALSAHEITTEVDRYISWPGQALSYKLGELKIRELRARAEKALGAQFDLRDFHDAVLAQGSLPLPLLETQIDAFIREKSGGAKAVE